MNKEEDLRKRYHSASLIEKKRMVEQMSPALYGHLRYKTRFFLRENQVMPDDFTGRYFIAQCGRGFGKSFMGSAWLAEKAKAGVKELAMVGPNFDDLTSTMVPAFQSHFPPNARPRYVGGNQSRIICPNDVIVKCYTSETEIRGGNFRYIWCDEIAKWCQSIDETITERFMTLDMTNRKAGSQFFITTTPKPFAILKRWQKLYKDGNPNYLYVHGTIDDNTFLGSAAVEALKAAYGETRAGRAELQGLLLEDTEGALWTRELIEKSRLPENYWKETFESKEGQAFYRRVVIGVDPAGGTTTDSDLTGIVVMAMDDEMTCYVLEDATNHYTPLGWAKKLQHLVEKYDADCIVAERNYGGAMVESNIKAQNPDARIKLVDAKKAKILRAEPAATRFELGKAFICGTMQDLEDQMTSYTGDPRQKSPDRLDAMVYAMKELCLDKIYVHRNFDSLGYV